MAGESRYGCCKKGLGRRESGERQIALMRRPACGCVRVVFSIRGQGFFLAVFPANGYAFVVGRTNRPLDLRRQKMAGTESRYLVGLWDIRHIVDNLVRELGPEQDSEDMEQLQGMSDTLCNMVFKAERTPTEGEDVPPVKTGLQRLRDLRGELDAVGLSLAEDSRLCQEDAERLQDASDALAEVEESVTAEETPPTEDEDALLVVDGGTGDDAPVPLVQREMTVVQRLRDLRGGVERAKGALVVGEDNRNPAMFTGLQHLMQNSADTLSAVIEALEPSGIPEMTMQRGQAMGEIGRTDPDLVDTVAGLTGLSPADVKACVGRYFAAEVHRMVHQCGARADRGVAEGLVQKPFTPTQLQELQVFLKRMLDVHSDLLKSGLMPQAPYVAWLLEGVKERLMDAASILRPAQGGSGQAVEDE